MAPAIRKGVAIPAIGRTQKRGNDHQHDAQRPKHPSAAIEMASLQSPCNGPRFGECLLRVQGHDFIFSPVATDLQQETRKGNADLSGR